jgi:dolichyl-phosphate-mannose--protein O-mannosyl transferase
MVGALESWCERPRRWRRIAGEAAILVVVPAAIYVADFAVHFALLPDRHPPTDASFAESFMTLHQRMLAGNAAMTPDQNLAASKWYTWPIAKTGVGYWHQADPASGTERWIILFGNPFVWWGVLIGAGAVLIALARGAKSLAPRRAVLVALGAGYLCNFLPFALITRPMFLYHYLFALVYSVLFVSVGVGALAGWDGDGGAFWRFPNANSRWIFVGVACATCALFLYLIPLTYGSPLSAAGLAHRRWILERHGS